jgi:hypothetical protein
MRVISVRDRRGRTYSVRAAAAPKPAAKPAVRALVVIPQAEDAPDDTPRIYRPATFLAHLVATRTQVPQARERRRAEPADAIVVYQTAMNQGPTDPRGQRLSRLI